MESKFTPLCRTARGCKIEDIATDTEVTRLADTYIKIRRLLAEELYRPIALDELKKEGLADPKLLVMLEDRVQKFNLSKMKQKEAKSKGQGK